MTVSLSAVFDSYDAFKFISSDKATHRLQRAACATFLLMISISVDSALLYLACGLSHLEEKALLKVLIFSCSGLNKVMKACQQCVCASKCVLGCLCSPVIKDVEQKCQLLCTDHFSYFITVLHSFSFLSGFHPISHLFSRL